MKKVLPVFFIYYLLVVSSGTLSEVSSKGLKSSYPGMIKMIFREIEADTRIKVALFLDDGKESLRALDEAMKIKDSQKYPYYIWAWVDCRNKACEPAFKVNFPHIFTQTPVGGIEAFSSKFNVDNFQKFEKFRTLEVTTDKVLRYENEKQIKKLLQEKPVFFKMYEKWCVHSKKMKKSFQVASNEVDKVYLVEVECSKSGGFCGKFGVNSYPSLKLVNRGGEKMYSYSGSRQHMDLIDFLRKDSWDFTEEAPKGISQ